jgi:hypothetical protein
MNPWTLIGWIVFAAVMLPLLAMILIAIPTWLAHNAMHRRTRNDAPKAGDIWIQQGTELYIDRVLDDGRVCIETDLPGGSRSSWSDSLESWRRRVKQRKLWRTKP